MATVLNRSSRIRTTGFVPRRTLVATICLILIVVLWEGYGYVTAPSRISPRLQTELAAAKQPYYDVSIRLSFAPKQFHIRQFQTLGMFAGATGTTALVRRVTPDKIAQISRSYWVQQVDLAEIK